MTGALFLLLAFENSHETIQFGLIFITIAFIFFFCPVLLYTQLEKHGRIQRKSLEEMDLKQYDTDNAIKIIKKALSNTQVNLQDTEIVTVLETRDQQVNNDTPNAELDISKIREMLIKQHKLYRD